LQIPTQGNVDDRLQEEETVVLAIQKIRATLTEQELYQLKRVIYDNASHKELASELGISIWTSQKRLERARDKLARLFPRRRKEKN